MANYTRIFRKDGKITEKELEGCLKEINKDIFYNTLPIRNHGNGSFVLMRDTDGDILDWWIEDKPFMTYSGEDGNVISKKTAKNYVEMRSVPLSKYMRWINEIVEKEVIKRLDLKVYDEGIGFYEPDPYPKTFKEFIKRSWRFGEQGWLKKITTNLFIKGDYNNWCKLAKEKLPQDFVDLFIDDKSKKRNKTIDKVLK